MDAAQTTENKMVKYDDAIQLLLEKADEYDKIEEDSRATALYLAVNILKEDAYVSPGPERKIKAVFTVVEDESLQKPIFRRIGTGFVNRDDSLNIILEALPVSGRLHIRDSKPEND